MSTALTRADIVSLIQAQIDTDDEYVLPSMTRARSIYRALVDAGAWYHPVHDPDVDLDAARTAVEVDPWHPDPGTPGAGPREGARP